MENLRVRKAMLEAGITQRDLAEILGRPRSYVSTLLSVELAKSRQDEIIRVIRENANADT